MDRQTENRRRLPTFLIGGAAQSGTSFLAVALRQHPQVYLPVRMRPEPHYFYYADLYAKPLSWYQDTWFSETRCATAIGEKSSSYLFGENVAGRIASRLPSVKLIFVLRNPIERMFSNYRFTVMQGLETRSFDEVASAGYAEPTQQEGAVSNARPLAYAARGLYGAQLSRFEAHFPKSQMLILKAEDMFRDPQAVLRRCFSFIGVDPDFTPKRPAEFPIPVVRDPVVQKELRATIGAGFPDILDSVRRREDPLTAWADRVDPSALRRLVDNFDWGKQRLAPSLRRRLHALFASDLEILADRVDFPIDDWRRDPLAEKEQSS